MNFSKMREIFRKETKMPENLTQGQEPAAAQNPFDTSAEQTELDALNAELEQARASMESDFAKVEAQKFNSDTTFQELFFENPEAAFLQVLQDQNEYLATNIAPKEQRAEQLNADISQKQQFGAIDAGVKAFQQKHPDVDVAALLNFLTNEVPPQVRAELESLPPEQMLEELLVLFEQVKNGASQNAEPQGENLPQQIQGVPTDAVQVQGGGFNESYITRM